MKHHGGLSHAGTCGEYGEVAGLPASGGFIEFVKPGRYAGGFSSCCGFDPSAICLVDLIADLVYGLRPVSGVKPGRYGIYGLSCLFEQVGYVDGLVGGRFEKGVHTGEE